MSQSTGNLIRDLAAAKPTGSRSRNVAADETPSDTGQFARALADSVRPARRQASLQKPGGATGMPSPVRPGGRDAAVGEADGPVAGSSQAVADTAANAPVTAEQLAEALRTFADGDVPQELQLQLPDTVDPTNAAQVAHWLAAVLSGYAVDTADAREIDDAAAATGATTEIAQKAATADVANDTEYPAPARQPADPEAVRKHLHVSRLAESPTRQTRSADVKPLVGHAKAGDAGAKAQPHARPTEPASPTAQPAAGAPVNFDVQVAQAGGGAQAVKDDSDQPPAPQPTDTPRRLIATKPQPVAPEVALSQPPTTPAPAQVDPPLRQVASDAGRRLNEAQQKPADHAKVAENAPARSQEVSAGAVLLDVTQQVEQQAAEPVEDEDVANAARRTEQPTTGTIRPRAEVKADRPDATLASREAKPATAVGHKTAQPSRPPAEQAPAGPAVRLPADVRVEVEQTADPDGHPAQRPAADRPIAADNFKPTVVAQPAPAASPVGQGAVALQMPAAETATGTAGDPTGGLATTAGAGTRAGASVVPGSGASADAAGQSVVESFDAAANGDRIAQAAVARLGGGGGMIRLQLDPPGMGSVQVNMAMGGHSIRLTLLPGSESAADLLSSQLSHLRESLQAHGLSVTHLSVQGPRAGEAPSHAGGQGGDDQPGDGGGRQTSDGQDGRGRESFANERNTQAATADAEPAATAGGRVATGGLNLWG